MSDKIAGIIKVGPQDSPTAFDDFEMHIGADFNITLELKNGTNVVASIGMTDDFATFLSGYLAPEKRRELWKTAAKGFNKSRH